MKKKLLKQFESNSLDIHLFSDEFKELMPKGKALMPKVKSNKRKNMADSGGKPKKGK